jgi:hypothetical protein
MGSDLQGFFSSSSAIQIRVLLWSTGLNQRTLREYSDLSFIKRSVVIHPVVMSATLHPSPSAVFAISISLWTALIAPQLHIVIQFSAFTSYYINEFFGFTHCHYSFPQRFGTHK